MPETITFQHYEVLVRDDGTPWELGRGAMGVTYKALDTNLRVPVALKVIHPRQLDSELVAQRFVREARAAARLRHPHIAAVYHLGQEGENWFYAMEFVDGDTAEAMVKREGALPEPTVLPLAIQAARALNAAAALGLVHRDIKPSNLMLTRDGDEWQLKLIDFGLARTFAGDESDEDLAAVTHSGFVGTPYYASPEQLEQHELDIRSDIYSLGVTLWYLLTGKVPFTGSVVSVLSQHLHKTPPFEQLDGIVSAATRQIIERMLAKDPAARPQTARDLRHELEQCEDTLTGTRVKLERGPVPATPEPASVAETAETLAAPSAPSVASQYKPGESHFDAGDTVVEFGFGQLCRARDRESGADFALLRLGPEHGLDESSLAHLRETVARARQIEHEQVWKIHALESDSQGLRVVMGWSAGYPWRDLLRRQRELESSAAFPLLAQAARGIDAILAAAIDQPDVTLAGLWCEATAAYAPPVNVKVSPLGVLRTLSLNATWVGDSTLAGGAQSPVTGMSGAIRSLAEVAYETLGGISTAPGLPPLPALSEGANKVLRTALRDPGQFASASSLIEHLSRAQTEAAPTTNLRAVSKRQTATLAATHTPTASRSEHLPEPQAEPGYSVTPIWAEPAPADAAPAPDAVHPAADSRISAATGESPIPTDEQEISREVAEPAPAANLVPPETHSYRHLATATALVLIAGSAAWLYLHPRKQRSETPPLVAQNESTPHTAIPPENTKPVATSTPAPLLTTPPPRFTPTTPAPTTPPPQPSKAEIAREGIKRAEEFRQKQQWEDSAKEWLALRKKIPETPLVADIGLEQLFREVRWNYTPRDGQKTQVTKSQVESLVPLVEEAAKYDIAAAKMLLGQHFTPTDTRKAIEWYRQAAPTSPKANTRIGLVLTNQKEPKKEDMIEAWKRFQDAAAAGDLDGRIVVAETLLFGTLNDGSGKTHTVPGLVRDEQRGTTILLEVIGETKSQSNTLPFEPAQSDMGDAPYSLAEKRGAERTRPDTLESQPHRAKVVLAQFYLRMESMPENARPQWYRDESKTHDHGRELRQLLTDASIDRAEAFAHLAEAADKGIGGPKDPVLAQRFITQGAERGEPQSMYYRAFYLADNRKPADIPTEARTLMVAAAEKGEPKAIAYCKNAKIPVGTAPQR